MFVIFLYLDFKLSKSSGTVFNWSLMKLFTSDFKLANSTFFAKDDVSTPVGLFASYLLHK